MLGTRQKIYAINATLKGLLQSGVYPTLAQIYKSLGKRYKARNWGQPQAQLRPAIEGQPIGGQDGKDIERTFQEIREDMTTYYHELVDTADKSLSNFWIFEAKKDILKRRLLHVIQSSESLLTTLALGGTSVVGDTFNSSENVDLTTTTADINIEEGYVTLPASLNSMCPIPLIGATVENEIYPSTGKPHGQILDALTDASNTGWYASLDSGSYSCTLRLPSEAASTEANGLCIDPSSPMNIKISYTNDLYNYYPLVDEKLIQEKTWTFKPTKVAALRIEVSGTNVGIRRLKLTSTGFESTAVLESTPQVVTDLFGNTVPIDSIRLQTDTDCPAMTSIKAYVQPIYADGTTGGWISAGDSATWLSGIQFVDPMDIRDLFKKEPQSDSNSRAFYTTALGANPVVDSSRLVKGASPDGLGQIFVEYMEHDWEADLDSTHIPANEDWDSFGTVACGYMRPYTVAYPSDNTSDHIQTGSDELVGNFITEAAVTSEITSTSLDWLTIGISGSGSSSALMQPKGNYRFTMYVYCPADLVVSDKPCLVYNPTDKGGVNEPVIAPFRIYMNDEIISDSRTSWSGDLLTGDTSDRNASFSFKQGWNKLQVLVYYTGASSVGGSGDIAAGGIGLYIGLNPYHLVRTNPGTKIQAHWQEEKLVSEFGLRQLTRPEDNSCWAWTDTAPKRNALLNYDPAAIQVLDSINILETPMLLLSYYVSSENRPVGIRVRADLSRQPDAYSVPKLHSYRVIVNQAGN